MRAELNPARAGIADLMWQWALRLGYGVARQWWRLRRPPHHGALVAIWVGDSLLLLRPSYRRGWNLPGGGVNDGETALDAALRETREEVSLEVPADALVPAGEVRGLFEYRDSRVSLFELRLDRLPPLRLDNREIIGFRLADASARRSLPLTRAVAAYLAQRAVPAAG